jgi:tetratricopeptide (TPR) repeat protein
LDAYQKGGRIFEGPLLQSFAVRGLATDRAAYHQKLGELWAGLGNLNDAIDQFEQARLCFQTLPDSVQRRIQLAELDVAFADAHQRLGDLRLADQRLSETETSLREAMEDPVAATPALAAKLARVRSVWGSVLVRLGHNDRAAALLQQAAQDYDRLLNDQPDERAYVEARAFAELNRAQSMAMLGEPALEAEAYRSAIADFEAVLDLLTDVPYLRENLAIAHCGLGSVANRSCQNKESIQWVDAGLAEFEQLANRPAPSLRCFEGLATAGSTMGAILTELGSIELARENLLSSITLWVDKLMPRTGQVGRYHRDTAIASARLGLLYHQQGKFEDARNEFDIAIQLLNDVLKVDSAEIYARDALASVLESLADLLREQGHEESALKYYREALEHREDAHLPPFPVLLSRKASLLLKFEEADKIRAARTIALQLYENHSEHGGFRALLARAYTQAGEFDAAIGLLEATQPQRHLEAGPARDFCLCLAYARRALAGDDQRAREAYERAMEWTDREAPGNLPLRRLALQAANLLGMEAPYPERAAPAKPIEEAIPVPPGADNPG